MKKLFVTVGTTQFDDLIKTVCCSEILSALHKLGYRHLTLQTGQGSYEPDVTHFKELKIEVYRKKPSIADDIKESDLVISHAGAGSVLETLHAGKPLIVVINEKLMGNHQIELAHQLYKDGHLYYGTCSDLLNLLTNMDMSKLKPFEDGNPQKFGDYIDKVMGFA